MQIDVKHKPYAKIKAKKRSSARAEKRQGYAYNRQYRRAHTYINYRLGKNHCKNSHANKLSAILFGKPRNLQAPETDAAEQQNYRHTAQKAELLANAYENKIVKAVGHNSVLRKIAV